MTPTPQEIRATCTYHHTALFRGYISRRSSPIVRPYQGRYGTGYTVLRPNMDSTHYSYIDYYITPKTRVTHHFRSED